MSDVRYLLAEEPLDIDGWLAGGGGEALRQARELGSRAVIDQVSAAKLRGRGGAGFPTGVKWRGVAERPEGQSSFLVCNAAEGEPGTFKDRALMRTNPFQLLEGIAIGAFAIGAARAFIGIKSTYQREIQRLEEAAAAMADRGLAGDVPIDLVTGPDDYLLGEEKALLEVIEGRDPLPRVLPPYLHGLHGGAPSGVGAGSVGWDDRSNPTVVNNVETLSHVPHIVRNGPDWFRGIGTEDTPGTMVFTVSGDVVTETVIELPMGTPLAVLLHGAGEGALPGRSLAMAFPGASNAPIPAAAFDVPMDFGSLRRFGSGLGSGGFIVGDDSACPVRSAEVLSGFLARSSCGQCPPCTLGTEGLRAGLAGLGGENAERALDDISGWIGRVTDANRCGLGAGAQVLVDGLLRDFAPHVALHLEGGCRLERGVPLAALVDHVPDLGRFVRRTE